MCDGNKGTPDLRNRFVLGAGQDGGIYVAGINSIGTGYYSPGNIGGEDTHKLTINEMPKHKHLQSFGNNNGTPTYYGPGSVGGGYTTMDSAYLGTGSLPYTFNDGNDMSHETRPPYYALAYIMKL